MKAVVLLTHKCNFNCDFCLNKWRSESCPKDLALDEYKIILANLKRAGVTKIIFSGGEPLLNSDVVEILEFAHDLGFDSSLQTNGFFVSEDFLEKAKDLLSSIQVSIEGTKEYHDNITNSNSFDRIMKSMKLIVRKGIRLNTNFTVTSETCDCIEQYMKLLNEIGVNTANITRLYRAGNALQNWDKLCLTKDEFIDFLKRLEKIESRSKTKICLQGPIPLCLLANNNIRLNNVLLCSAGESICVQPNGKITPCPSDPTIIGDALEGVFNSKRKNVIMRFGLVDECKSCPAFSKCKGACYLCAFKGKDIYAV